MRVLITGASGFLGSHIVDACLAQGFSVRVIVRPSSNCSYLDTLGNQIELLKGNFNDEHFLNNALAGINVVIHSAARVSNVGNWKLFYNDNVKITELLLACAQKQKISRFVFVSSPSVVAELRDQININESYPYPSQFLNYYCQSKAIAEQQVLQANSKHFITCALRPRAIWGPRDTTGPFAKILKKIHTGRFKRISNLQQLYSSICYVKHAANACVNATLSPKVAGKTYFITDAEPINLWPFIDQFVCLFKLPPVQHYIPRALVNFAVPLIEFIWKIPYLKNNIEPPATKYTVGLITYSATYNISQAKQDLNYTPIMNREQCIKEFQDWIESIGGIDNYLNSIH